MGHGAALMKLCSEAKIRLSGFFASGTHTPTHTHTPACTHTHTHTHTHRASRRGVDPSVAHTHMHRVQGQVMGAGQANLIQTETDLFCCVLLTVVATPSWCVICSICLPLSQNNFPLFQGNSVHKLRQQWHSQQSSLSPW